MAHERNVFFNCRVRKRCSGVFLAQAENYNPFLFQNQNNSSRLVAGSDLLFLLLLCNHFILNVLIQKKKTRSQTSHCKCILSQGTNYVHHNDRFYNIQATIHSAV